MQAIEEALREDFLPNLMGREVTEWERKAWGLPMKDGGLGLIPPTEAQQAGDPYRTSTEAAHWLRTAMSKDAAYRKPLHMKAVRDAKERYEEQKEAWVEQTFKDNSRIRFFEGRLEKPRRDGNAIGHSQEIRVASFEVVPVDPDRSLRGLQDRRVLSFCSFAADPETEFLSAADAMDSFGSSTGLWDSEVLSFDPHVVTLMLEGPEVLVLANSTELSEALVMANSTELSEALVMANSTELQVEPSLSGRLRRRRLSSWRRQQGVKFYDPLFSPQGEPPPVEGASVLRSSELVQKLRGTWSLGRKVKDKSWCGLCADTPHFSDVVQYGLGNCEELSLLIQ
uniref:Uncharacterized protein n=1 Tax=Chromera velia CCMP2878 TaxID=1169474 RepID=A0A0G4I9J8_9ALVE|eukprot:Cvel_12174.t1-p1 / transcript=Cvel_12174.t1 / gene=Cvel_12174 / organism=Chromera_velia_CCMP2878 / gene_product=hypothetical protein / transcript_product=hypothetical protein / location=Cvel_scaffold786:18747-22591(-) / protein_length=338 / sequence_SO=supercontig / SO=protein_coding / is_pseudo=false